MRTWLLLFATACAWDAPDNANSLSAPPLANVLSGSVAWPGDGDPANTFVTVYDAANPGPPVGLGGPITFSSVLADDFTTDTTGLQSAPFAIGDIPDGTFLVNALMDVDGDFNPLSSVLTGATCGDWIGTHLEDLTSTTQAAVTAEGGVEVDELPVVLGTEVTIERPVFRFKRDGDGNLPVMSREIGKQSGANILLATQMQYRLHPAAVDSILPGELVAEMGPECAPDPGLNCSVVSACPCDVETLAPCETAMWVWFVDDDDDGVLDPYPGETQAEAGFYNVWPRIYLEYLGEPVEVDGVTTYESGLEPGERWVAENFPLGFDLFVNPDPTPHGPLDVPFPVQELNVLWSPVFRHYWEGGLDGADVNGPFDLVDLREDDVAIEDVPSGRYAVTIVSFTGQVWTLPNALGLEQIESLSADIDNAQQAGFLTVE